MSKNNVLSANESRVVENLAGVLAEKFGISTSDVTASIVRDVEGISGGRPSKRDKLVMQINVPVIDDKGEEVSGMPIQHLSL